MLVEHSVIIKNARKDNNYRKGLYQYIRIRMTSLLKELTDFASFPPHLEYNTKRSVPWSLSFIPDCRQSVSLLIMYSVPKIKKEISFYRYLYGNKSCPSPALADQLSCRSCEEMSVLRTNLLCRKS